MTELTPIRAGRRCCRRRRFVVTDANEALNHTSGPVDLIATNSQAGLMPGHCSTQCRKGNAIELFRHSSAPAASLCGFLFQ